MNLKKKRKKFRNSGPSGSPSRQSIHPMGCIFWYSESNVLDGWLQAVLHRDNLRVRCTWGKAR